MKIKRKGTKLVVANGIPNLGAGCPCTINFAKSSIKIKSHLNEAKWCILIHR